MVVCHRHARQVRITDIADVALTSTFTTSWLPITSTTDVHILLIESAGLICRFGQGTVAEPVSSTPVLSAFVLAVAVTVSESPF